MSIKFLLFFGLIPFITPSECVVNGSNVTIEEYPFIVSFSEHIADGPNATFAHLCGGSILNENWILTAAHCSGNVIRIGVSNFTTDPPKDLALSVILWIRHEKYNSWTLENDIAVVRVAQTMSFNDQIQPVKLPHPMEEIPGNWETKAHLTGFTKYGSNITPLYVLQETEVLIVSNEECEMRHENGMIFPNMQCAGNPEGGTGQCRDDHGGPLTINETQIGIASWSLRPCASPAYPGVYTKVSHYVDWIKEKTGM